MKTLQDIKDNYAQQQGYEDWADLYIVNCINFRKMERHMGEICIRAQKVALERAAEPSKILIYDTVYNFPDNVEIWKWWQKQRFQKEQGEQEYTMIYEIDLPKILRAFYEHITNKNKDK